MDDGRVHRARGQAQAATDAARSSPVAGFRTVVRRVVGVATLARQGARRRLADRAPAVMHRDPGDRVAVESTSARGLGVEPRRARRVVCRVHSQISPGVASPGKRQDRFDRGPGQSNACQLPLVRLRRHRSRFTPGAAPQSLAAGRCPRLVRRPDRRACRTSSRSCPRDRLEVRP